MEKTNDEAQIGLDPNEAVVLVELLSQRQYVFQEARIEVGNAANLRQTLGPTIFIDVPRKLAVTSGRPFGPITHLIQRTTSSGATLMIYLLRHGETIWNTLGRFQGQKDSPLTERGIEQADRVAKLLQKEISESRQSFQMHISPLGRTRQTAERVKRVLPLATHEEARLMEVSVGCWDGMTKFEIDTEFPEMLDGSDAFDWYFKSPDGESFDAACSRAKDWIADVTNPTVAVSHGLFGRLVRGVYSGLSKREILELPVPQDGFYRLCDGEFSIVSDPVPSMLA